MNESESRPLQTRLNKVESALAHHQYDYEALNQVVIEQQSLLVKLQQRVAQLEDTLNGISQSLPVEKRDLADDKPPHY